MKEKICGVYLITNNINGMSYTGQSKDCKLRWTIHKNPSQKKLPIDKAINEYGVDNFTFKIEKECLPEDLDFYEREVIKKYNTLYPNGYNYQGGGKNGFEFCEESRRKMSENNKGENNYFYGRHPFGEDNPMFGRHHTEEAKRKISENNKGRQISDDHKKKLSELWSGEKNPNYGNHAPLSEEHKRKISESSKGKHTGPKPKSKWLTPNGEIKIMDKSNAMKFHPDWIQIKEE